MSRENERYRCVNSEQALSQNFCTNNVSNLYLISESFFTWIIWQETSKYFVSLIIS